MQSTTLVQNVQNSFNSSHRIKALLFLASHPTRYVLNQNPLGSPGDDDSQFAGQEPEDDAGIAAFCERNHGVTFPLMAKSNVNGDDSNEVYKYLKSQKAGLLGLTRIKVCGSHRDVCQSISPHRSGTLKSS